MLARDELTGFLKALCRYYSDFLETDFHASRAPSRKIQTKNAKGQLTAFDFLEYPEVGRVILGSFLERFENPLPSISRSASNESLSTDFAQLERPPLYRKALELFKNLELHDKHSAYLYLFPFELDGTSYPLIYIPVDLELSDTQDQIDIIPSPVMFINTQALRFMAHTLSERLNRQWTIDVPDRQLFFGSLTNQELFTETQRLFNVLEDFDEAGSLSVRKFGESSSGKTLSLRNTIYLAVAPQGDEALVSDYEDLLLRLQRNPDDPSVAGMMDVIENFLFQNPKSVQQLVEDQLNDEPMTSRISYPSPIPLNNEQLMVAQALRMPDCSRIVIEGPPGTGKSHTIAGLVFEALRDQKSVLLVSDKKEALDVVEDKINAVLDLSKLDDSFQNPILRLGAKSNNFSKIFYEGNLVKIRARQQALRMRAGSIAATVKQLRSDIEADARVQVGARMELYSASTAEACAFEADNPELSDALVSLEAEGANPEALETLASAATSLKLAVQNFYGDDNRHLPGEIDDLTSQMVAIRNSLTALSNLDVSASRFLRDINSQKLPVLEAMPRRILALKSGIVGFLFKGNALAILAQELLQVFPSSGSEPIKARIDEIARDAGLFRQAADLQGAFNVAGLDALGILKSGHVKSLLDKADAIQSTARSYKAALSILPKTSSQLGFSSRSLRDLIDKPISIDVDKSRALIRFVKTATAIADSSTAVKAGSYLAQRGEIEKNLALTMSSLLDQSVIRYSDEHKSDAVTVRKLIRERKQIPRSLLPAVASAFPCIIIGIRELGSYIPFEFGLFDIVIIDEASQVSIAQALPAILRAKKTVVLGDPKQFSNVKAAFAGSALNAAAFSRVRGALTDALKDNDPELSRHLIDKSAVFNIKTSVLEFTRYLANYTGFLRKHFRGYNELITYSNEQFYKNLLQVMKIRWKPLRDIIRFKVLESPVDSLITSDNTNEVEAEYIMGELDKLLESDFNGSVAIITPFTDQQALIMSKTLASNNSRAYRRDLRLKVMTFDTCQGEERDVVFYSMVERPGESILRFIFPASIGFSNDEEDGDLRRQRLNVGLSRAKESVRFVLSKPVSELTGEIGNALRTFERQLSKPDFADLQGQTDSRSPKESELLQALSQTAFYRENEARLEIRPQFPIGELIRQLDPLAQVPKFVSDFLLIFSHEDGSIQRVIVEYDGVESHFENPELVNRQTYDQLRCEHDVERMRIIESYGYPIMALNKFVLGRHPVQVLDKLLSEVFKKKSPTLMTA